MDKDVPTHTAFLSLWSFWTRVAQEPREACGNTRLPQPLEPGARAKPPTTPATPSEVTHLESQGALGRLWGQREK